MHKKGQCHENNHVGGKASCDWIHKAIDVQELLKNKHEGSQCRVSGKSISYEADCTETMMVLSHARHINH